MSAKSRVIQSLIQAFEKWPKDSDRVYGSFKESQLERFQHGLTSTESSLPGTLNLETQLKDTQELTNNTNSDKVS